MDLTAKHYDGLRDATEHPDDPKPTSKDAMDARVRAIAQGRLKAPPRDEHPEIRRRVAEIAAEHKAAAAAKPEADDSRDDAAATEHPAAPAAASPTRRSTRNA
jgi:hypothetical protein